VDPLHLPAPLRGHKVSPFDPKMIGHSTHGKD
jgi:hypothetical protein